MGVYLSWNLMFDGDEEELLLRLNRARARIEELPVRSVGPIKRLEPLSSASVLFAMSRAKIQPPPVVAERIQMIWGDKDLFQRAIYLDLMMLQTIEDKSLWSRWFVPLKEFMDQTDLWRAEDYPAWVRDGHTHGFVPVTQCLDELPRDEEEGKFFGSTMNRACLLTAFAEAMIRYAYLIEVSAGEHCESLWFWLSTCRGADRPLWLGHSSAKTQYATSLELTHRTAVRVIDAFAAEGLLLSAEDDSGYYEHRDWSQARKVFGAELAFAGLMSGLAGALVQREAGPDAKLTRVVDNAGQAFERLADLGMSPAEAMGELAERVAERNAEDPPTNADAGNGQGP
jgi:hypothetical protein